jgi:hypothetical protein
MFMTITTMHSITSAQTQTQLTVILTQFKFISRQASTKLETLMELREFGAVLDQAEAQIKRSLIKCGGGGSGNRPT